MYKTYNPKQKKQKTLRIIPLGGQEEVGRNMTVFEYGDDIVILDMGLQFPEEDMPGIDYIVPDISYLKGKEKKIRGVIFSHGHLDHIGAAPILLEQLGYPLIIGRNLTLALIKRKTEDYKKNSERNLKTILVRSTKDKITLGSFNISFFEIEHSIMDAVGVIINTPTATVIHPGDWTIGRDTADQGVISYTHLSKLPRPTILMLESLGATQFEKSTSEKEMYDNLEKIINIANGKVIIGTFSSQIRRIGHILQYAQKIGKKVAVDGYSMKTNIEIARQLGYIKVDKDTLISIKDIGKYPNNKIVIICTGAQGEGNAVLSRIIDGHHKFIKIDKKDTVIFSSSVIPGNERTVQRLKDNLYRKCDNVIHSDIMNIHTSGHCTASDIKDIVKEIQPDYFLPVYANHFFLKESAKRVMEIGFPESKIFILDNGSIIEFKNNSAQILPKKIKIDYIFVDGLGVGDVGEIVLKDRQTLAQDGMFVIVVIVDRKTGKVKGSPDIISRGFIYLRESKELLAETRKRVIGLVNKTTVPGRTMNWINIKNNLRNDIGKFLFRKTQRKPMILPVVIEV